MYKKLITIFLSLALSGCAGFMVSYSSEETYDAKKVTPSTTIRGDCCDDIYYDAVTTKSGIKAIWGDPDEIINEGKIEKWKYSKKSMAWGGFVPIIILPIPIVIPIGHEFTIISFDGDNVLSATTKTSKTYIAACGLFMNDAGSDLNFECNSE